MMLSLDPPTTTIGRATTITYDSDLPLTKASLFQELLTVTGTENLRWEGVHFEYATWLGASGPKGYVDTQSGCELLAVVSPCAHRMPSR